MLEPSRMVVISSGPVARHEVGCGDMRASLALYTARGRQRPHRHDYTQISFLLSGSMAEQLEGRKFELDCPAMCAKPAGALHEDEWGAEGVLIFSLKLPPATSTAPGWRKVANPRIVGQLARACLTHNSDDLRTEAAFDLLDLDFEAEAGRPSAPPAWLRSARDQLFEAPTEKNLAAVASDAGVDRAHFSRLFRKHFGMPPSLFRQRRLAGRAIAAISRSSEPLSVVAVDAGYCDQAHLNRGIKAQTGMTPGTLRHLLGRADHIRSIQGIG